MSFNDFTVNIVANSGIECINPYFPSIHIKTNKTNNAWLHIVRTDAESSEDLRLFIDSDHMNKDQYPFYSFSKDFYDAPLWQYNLLFKTGFSFWEGHAYAVMVDSKNKTIKHIGGVLWGFKLQYTSLRPAPITPAILTENDWENDWKIFKVKLPGYKLIR